MEMIDLKSGYDTILEALPDSWAVFAFYKDKQCLLFSKSGNLRFRLSGMYKRKDSDSALSELFVEADRIGYRVFDEPIMALLMEKIHHQKHTPLLQYRHQVWQNYAYLALDASCFPFVSIEDSTNDNRQYIGPFRSRFYLADLMDTLGRILKVPFCETQDFPCERLDKDLCRGYCFAQGNEDAYPELKGKLPALLHEAYLHPMNGILELVKKQRDHYFDELEFDKCDLLTDEVDLLSKYRDWLNFLYVCKDISFEDDLLTVKKGQITEARVNGNVYKFPIQNIEYRENEKLALNKDITDECRMVYTYFIKNTKR